jgi:hypothetical protein
MNNNNSNFTEDEMNIVLGISNNIINDAQTDIIIIDEVEKLKLKKEKLRASQKKYFEKNRQKIYSYNRQYFNEKYNNDKIYREKRKKSAIELSKNKKANDEEYRLKINERSRQYNNERRSKSPEYKLLINERNKAYYHRKKLLNETTNIIVSTC